MHAENNFNHIKESFLDYQRRNNSSVSPSQVIVCTCPSTGFNQPFCPQLNICPYLQEMDSESEGDEIDLGEENEGEDSYLDSEFQPEEHDTDSDSDEEVYFLPKKRKKGNYYCFY